jgi:chitin disaccharide deacetylase
MQPRPWIEPLLCADDFGLTAGINSAILKLGGSGKLNAASVMVEAPHMEASAAALASLRPRMQIGLHFNLTEDFGAETPFDLTHLIARWPLPSEKTAEVTRRLHAQLDRFEMLFGTPPDYVDGHRHIHVLPSVRSCFLETLARRCGAAQQKPWIRQVRSPLRQTDAPAKAALLNLLNLGFKRSCTSHGFACNDVFLGVYSLTETRHYAALLSKWLSGTGANRLIMCHPSDDRSATDPVADARLMEYHALAGIQ